MVRLWTRFRGTRQLTRSEWIKRILGDGAFFIVWGVINYYAAVEAAKLLGS